MADRNKIADKALSDEELNEAAGGFVIPSKKIAYVKCASEGCDNTFIPVNGEIYCSTCRQTKGNK